MNRFFFGVILSTLMFGAFPLLAQYEGNAPFCHQGGGLIINEISNGPTTGSANMEYVELVVTPDPDNPTAPVDLSGWILDDNNVAVSGEGNASGHFILGDCYQAVPPGSILVLFNPADRNPDLPADDPMDADQDGVYIIPADHACVQSCNSNPTTEDSNYCPCSDPNAPAPAWQIGLRNDGDLFQVRDACESVVHAISWGSVTLSDEVTSSPVYFKINNNSQSGLVISFTNDTGDNWNDAANFSNISVNSGQTPGAANSTANGDMISRFASGVIGECQGTIYNCAIADAGDLQAAGGINDSPIVLCQGEDLDAFTANYDQPDENEPMAPGFTFEYAFLFTSDAGPDYPILDFNFDGDFDFSVLPTGTYRIWGFSYIQTNGSVPLQDFLTTQVGSIADILAYTACGFDADLDSLNQQGQVVEVQVVDSPTAIAPTEPLQTCGDQPTATFDLTTYDPLISGGSSLPVVWYSDAGATQPITTPENYTGAAGTVFARLESPGCVSNIVSVALEIGGFLDLVITIDEPIDCDSPLGAISINIDDMDGLTIDWNINQYDGNTILTDLVPGSYSVTVTSEGGCADTAAIRLNSGSSVLAEFLAIQPSCDQPADGGIEVVDIIGGVAPYQISLNGGDYQPATNWSAMDLPSGTYTIIIQDGGGCETAQTVTLQPPPGSIIDLGPDIEIEEGDSLFFVPPLGFAITDLQWSPQAGISGDVNGLLINPTETTTYTFSAVTLDGCTVTGSLTVTVVPAVTPPTPEAKIFIPNAFSPNDDGVNDTFTIYAGSHVANVKSMRIFDRWGNFIFERTNFAPNDIRQGWDGLSGNQVLDMGVYLYFIELDFTDGHTEIFKGDVTIVR
ncbi:MAG: gliding motility-associated C-terminal domain-containing protein [Lewinella sp.]|nr:gliding motility-associated C-terminal domain-containing protein [Lewinella sp.]